MSCPYTECLTTAVLFTQTHTSMYLMWLLCIWWAMTFLIQSLHSLSKKLIITLIIICTVSEVLVQINFGINNYNKKEIWYNWQSQTKILFKLLDIKLISLIVKEASGKVVNSYNLIHSFSAVQSSLSTPRHLLHRLTCCSLSVSLLLSSYWNTRTSLKTSLFEGKKFSILYLMF